LSNCQFGFRKNRCTEDAVVSLTDFVLTQLDKKKHVLAVYLDIRKAFDSVSHSKLLIKLNKMGILGSAANLLDSYLTNRKQIVKINDCFSEVRNICSGVP